MSIATQVVHLRMMMNVLIYVVKLYGNIGYKQLVLVLYSFEVTFTVDIHIQGILLRQQAPPAELISNCQNLILFMLLFLII